MDNSLRTEISIGADPTHGEMMGRRTALYVSMELGLLLESDWDSMSVCVWMWVLCCEQEWEWDCWKKCW